MRVDIRSWHHQLFVWTYGPNFIPKNGCTYFWCTVASVLICPLLVFVRGTMWMAMQLPTIRMPKLRKQKEEVYRTHEEWMAYYKKRRNKMDRMNLVVRGFVAGINIYLGIWYFIRGEIFWPLINFTVAGFILVGTPTILWYLQKRRGKMETEPIKPKVKKKKDPNMVWLMVKATKNKYCPMLQFYDSQLQDLV